ncbi:UNVERIFIED_ORG: hypothetical protein GGE63_003353, partial [Rhizobium esperanzae]
MRHSRADEWLNALTKSVYAGPGIVSFCCCRASLTRAFAMVMIL